MKNKINIEKFYFPMLVSSTFGKEDSKSEILTRWDFFDTLSEEEKDVMISDETALAIKSIAVALSLDNKSSEELTRIVRNVFFHKITKTNIVGEIAKQIPAIQFENAKRVAASLNDKIFARIINLKREQEKKYLQTNLKELLEKYPKIENQLLSEEMLKSRFFPGPVRPSIKNWIADYHDALGAGKHSPIERGTYLFHGENGKRLTISERQKVGLILKSLDEDSLLTIDVENEKVIFNNQGESATNTSSQVGANNSNSQSQIPATQDVFEKFQQKNQNWPAVPASSIQQPSTSHTLKTAQTFVNPDLRANTSQTMTSTGLPKEDSKKTELLKPKEVEQKAQNFSPNFASGGTITFSSAHKLPVEQVRKNEPIQNNLPIQSEKQNITTEKLNVPSAEVFVNQKAYRISPQGNANYPQSPNVPVGPSQQIQEDMRPKQALQTTSINSANASQTVPHYTPRVNPFHISPRNNSDDSLAEEVDAAVAAKQKNVVNLRENQ